MKNTLHGYMTLEAALMMPLVWFCIFSLIFMGFFQYDRCIAEQDGRLMVLRATELRGKDEEEVIRTVLKEGELAGNKKLLFSKGIEKELHMSDDRAKIKISGGVNTILNNFVEAEKLTVFSYTAEYEIKKYDPVGFIRTCRRIEGYGEN